MSPSTSLLTKMTGIPVDWSSRRYVESTASTRAITPAKWSQPALHRNRDTARSTSASPGSKVWIPITAAPLWAATLLIPTSTPPKNDVAS